MGGQIMLFSQPGTSLVLSNQCKFNSRAKTQRRGGGGGGASDTGRERSGRPTHLARGRMLRLPLASLPDSRFAPPIFFPPSQGPCSRAMSTSALRSIYKLINHEKYSWLKLFFALIH